MELIVLYGLPRSGKSTLARGLSKKLKNSRWIEVDDFKLEAFGLGMDRYKGREFAYEKSLGLLEEYGKQDADYIILSEVFSDKKFRRDVLSYVDDNGINVWYFKIDRPMSELLKIEKESSRRVRNSPEDFLEFERLLGEFNPEGKVCFKNGDGVDVGGLVDKMVGVVV